VAARERQEAWLVARALKLQREIQRGKEAVLALRSFKAKFPDLFDAEPAADVVRDQVAPATRDENELDACDSGVKPGFGRKRMVGAFQN
jgi:hypothetical protein